MEKGYTFDRVLSEIEQPLITSAKIWGIFGAEVFKGVKKPLITLLDNRNRNSIGYRRLRVFVSSFSEGFYGEAQAKGTR